MKTITASAWGERLTTRFLGELARKEIEPFLSEGPITVDFSQVKTVGQSFADEFFGVLLTEHGKPEFLRLIHIAHADEDTRSVIRFVLAMRQRRAHA